MQGAVVGLLANYHFLLEKPEQIYIKFVPANESAKVFRWSLEDEDANVITTGELETGEVRLEAFILEVNKVSDNFLMAYVKHVVDQDWKVEFKVPTQIDIPRWLGLLSDQKNARWPLLAELFQNAVE